MTTFLDNQINLFHLETAVLDTTDTMSADPKTAADWSVTTVCKGKLIPKTFSNSELMKLDNLTL